MIYLVWLKPRTCWTILSVFPSEILKSFHLESFIANIHFYAVIKRINVIPPGWFYGGSVIEYFIWLILVKKEWICVVKKEIFSPILVFQSSSSISAFTDALSAHTAFKKTSKKPQNETTKNPKTNKQTQKP